MALEAGARLGPYEILDTLGAGGMGEVYRAKDTRLDRTVAVKVLPEHLSASPELKQRLEREAKVISSLSHPHICTLFDVGHHEGIDFLVMEYIEGESLAARLQKGPLPMEEVLHLGIQIADALDRAHKGGVIHRDLKPGNVMLTGSGVKLLDFGLAKQHAPAAPVSTASFSNMLTESPDSAALTREGTILGTFQYMAPEQIEGREADVRSDIFSFGAVLYEMATGRRAFSGKSQASLIGAIMHSRPEPVSKLVALSPPAFDRVVETCLAKDPEDRWGTAHDVRLQLEWIAEGGSQVGLPAPVAARRRHRERVAWVTAALFAAATATFVTLWVRRAPEAPRVIRFDVSAPKGVPVVGSPRLSPDGRYLAFNATDGQGKQQIWLRPLDAVTAQPLPGTDGAAFRPFWSPDSKYLGFIADGKLKRIPVSGGPPSVVCDAPNGADGAWSEDGVILYDGGPADPISKVAAGGGLPVPLVSSGQNDVTGVGWPQFLPGGERFLYVQSSSEGPAIMLASLDGGEAVKVLPGLSRVEYAPPGYLIYVREGSLVTQPFDAQQGKVTGDPVPLAQDLGVDSVGLAHFSTSHQGTLAFRGGEAGGAQVVWVDRKGQSAGAVVEPEDIRDLALSRDERWLALVIGGAAGGGREVWIRDLTRGVTSRFTFDEARHGSPVWSPDGTRLAYAALRDGKWHMYVKAVGGPGDEERLSDSENDQYPSDWSADGKHLAYFERAQDTSWDVWVMTLDGSQPPLAIAKTPFVEVQARFSPDGRWIAYNSNESGRFEIYVQPVPGPGRKWQISTAGGSDVHWRPDGTELYYVSPEQRLMRVAVRTGAAFDAGVPEAMFQANLRPVRANNRLLASRDGERFLTLASLSEDTTPPTTVVVNWPAELEQR